MKKPTQKGHYRGHNVNRNFEVNVLDVQILTGIFCVGQAWA